MSLRNWIGTTAFILHSCFAAAAGLQTGSEIPLWSRSLPPGSATHLPVEVAASAPRDNELTNNIVGILNPALVAFVPKTPNGTAIVIVPGGSYTKLTAAKEGVDIARWLNSLGITAFVLKHRLPNEGHAAGRQVVLQDGLRAIRLVRQNAMEWKLDPAKIGIMGFSAGGNLAATTGTAFEAGSYPAQDAIDTQSPRPDFMALIYPAVGFPAQHGIKARSESQAAFSEFATDEVPSVKTPPAFIMIAADDALAVRAVRFWQALAQAGNPPELHIAATGGHGFALKSDATPSVRIWPDLFVLWLKTKGFLAS